MDIKSPEARSRNMAKIKCSNTTPEVYIRTLLFRRGMRYRKNYAAVEGKPDLYFPTYRVAVFVHGCYWHRHRECPYAYTPKSNIEFWTKKLEGNRERDERISACLLQQGIRIAIVWECTVRKMKRDLELEEQNISILHQFITAGIDSFIEL